MREAYEEAKAGEYDYDGTVLELKETVKDSTEELDDLAEIMGKPMLLTAGFESGGDTSKSMEETMRQQMQAQMQQAQQQMQVPDQQTQPQTSQAQAGAIYRI